MYCRIGHANKHYIVKGQKVKKGDLIATVGTGNGQWSAHCHCDFPKQELSPWTAYVFGISKEGVKYLYSDPAPYRKIAFPEYDHMGWGYLEYADYNGKHCYHPGEDWNGKGAGNADLGDPIYAPFDGKIVYDFDDNNALNGGWGKVLVIQETMQNPSETMQNLPPAMSSIPSYQDLTSSKSQFQQMWSDLLDLITSIIKKVWERFNK